MTENNVERGAIAHYAFKGRFDCVVGFLGYLQQHLCQITLTAHTLMLPR